MRLYPTQRGSCRGSREVVFNVRVQWQYIPAQDTVKLVALIGIDN